MGKVDGRDRNRMDGGPIIVSQQLGCACLSIGWNDLRAAAAEGRESESERQSTKGEAIQQQIKQAEASKQAASRREVVKWSAPRVICSEFPQAPTTLGVGTRYGYRQVWSTRYGVHTNIHGQLSPRSVGLLSR